MFWIGYCTSYGKACTYFHQVLAVGPTGSGKTLCIGDKLLRHMPKDYLCHFLTFSARTSANQTQDIIDGKLDKRYIEQNYVFKTSCLIIFCMVIKIILEEMIWVYEGCQPLI